MLFLALDTLTGLLLPLLLLFGGGYLLVRLRAFFLLSPRACLSLFLKKEQGKNASSPLRAVSVALAGTLGVGNISGVALALLTGGAGSVFYMWLSALLAMALKYAEVTLSLSYRRADGSGGAMYYIEDGLRTKHRRILARAFAVLLLLSAFGVGSLVQANAVSEALQDTLSMPPLVTGALLSLLAAAVVFGGAKKISSVTLGLVPVMTLLYTLMAAVILCLRHEALPAAFLQIFREAAEPKAAVGGILGFLTSRAMRVGCARGVFSNEAGCGTATVAHAISDTAIPAKQGLYGILEVFIDSFLLCTLTALAILVTFPSSEGHGGAMSLVLSVFAATYGQYAPYILSLSVAVFALATILSFAYYGESAVRYLSGKKGNTRLFLMLYVLSPMLGAVAGEGAVFWVTDLLIAGLACINTVAVMRLSERVVSETRMAGLLPSEAKKQEMQKENADEKTFYRKI